MVCDFCEQHLEANKAAFADPRMHLIINDARAELEKYDGTFDVIIGDLADPVFGGPCYQVSHHRVIPGHLLDDTSQVLCAMPCKCPPGPTFLGVGNGAVRAWQPAIADHLEEGARAITGIRARGAKEYLCSAVPACVLKEP